MKILSIFLLVFISFFRCVVSEEQDCFIQARAENKGQSCEESIQLFIFNSNPNRNEMIKDLILFDCIQEYQVNKKCRKKSNVMPIIRWN
jgi:hypothetical protein